MNSADTPTPIGRTRIKICGVMDPDTALAAADAGADAIGFVFVPGSSRRVSPGRASEIMYALPPFITAVGVVADLSLDDFIELEQSCPTPAFQLHGDEPEDVVAQCGPGVLKAIRFSPDTIIAELTRWSAIPEVDAILIDAPTPGAGEPIDWAALRGAMDTLAEASKGESTAIVTKPIMLAGGLSPDNVAEAIRIVRPYAVDVSSGVESARGVKDTARIADFCAAVRSVPGG